MNRMAKSPKPSGTDYRGTVRKAAYFNPEKDAGILHTNLRGIGGDDSTIIAIASTRNACQRQEILNQYSATYGRDLIHDMKHETTGHFQETLVALFETATEYDARCLRKAMKGIGTDEKTIIEILITRSNKELQKIKEYYEEKYHREVERDIIDDASGEFRQMLLSLLTATRDESTTLSSLTAKQDAAALHREKPLGTHEKRLSEIFCRRSFAQLRLIFQEYEKVSGRDIAKAINSEYSGDLKELLKAIVEVARNPAAYFAERLYRSMKGAGTNDTTLIRVVVTRCEVDMIDIKQLFQEKHGKTLEKYIEGDTSGHYKKLLLSLVTE